MRAWIAAAALALVGAVVGIASASSGPSASSSGGAGERGPMPTIKLGSSGDAVATWQGVIGQPVSGRFDAGTEVATKVWQGDHGLEADGVVGAKSWAAAGFAAAAPAPKASGGGAPTSPATSSTSSGAITGGSAGGAGDGGHAWAARLPKEQTMAQPAILEVVRAGEAVYEWVELVIEAGGRRLVVEVLARALRVGTPSDSVAVTVDYDTAQAIAEHLDAYLLTPKLMLDIFHAADLKILPYPARHWQGTGTDETGTHTDRMVQHSDEMDAKGVLSAHLVSNEGKGWVISIRNWSDANPAKRHNAVNHGFFDEHGKPVQDRGAVHNRKHVDYSQLEYLVRRIGQLDGFPTNLRDVVRDPATAFLLSDEGRLPDLIHPDLGGAAA